MVAIHNPTSLFDEKQTRGKLNTRKVDWTGGEDVLCFTELGSPNCGDASLSFCSPSILM